MSTKDKLQQAQQGAKAQTADNPTTPNDTRRQALPPLLSRDDLRLFGITYSRAHLAKRIKDGTFPAPVALGPQPYARKCWKREDIEAWIAALTTTGGEAA